MQLHAINSLSFKKNLLLLHAVHLFYFNDMAPEMSFNFGVNHFFLSYNGNGGEIFLNIPESGSNWQHLHNQIRLDCMFFF